MEFCYEVNLLGPIRRVSRSDEAMNPFIYLLTGYRPKHSFDINLESDKSNEQCLEN